jgi:hypothetical protein
MRSNAHLGGLNVKQLMAGEISTDATTERIFSSQVSMLLN